MHDPLTQSLLLLPRARRREDCRRGHDGAEGGQQERGELLPCGLGQRHGPRGERLRRGRLRVEQGLGDRELAPAVLAAVGPVAALLVAHEGAEGVAVPRQGVLVDAHLPRREPRRDAPRPRHVLRVDARGQPVGRWFVLTVLTFGVCSKSKNMNGGYERRVSCLVAQGKLNFRGCEMWMDG